MQSNQTVVEEAVPRGAEITLQTANGADPPSGKAPLSPPEERTDPLDRKENAIWMDAPVREVRIGVTMVGGTSLAIYENGVAQELYQAARGRGTYGLLKKLMKSHILVDLLSGTSAGGINNIFLAAALATGNDLSVTKETWIARGGIGDLMQDPINKEVTSLFRGNTYYYGVLKEGFDRVYGTPYDEDTDVPSPDLAGPIGQELDLFVTGTFYEGMPYTFYDSRNQPIDTKNYHGVFHLKHRPRRTDRSNDLPGESHFHPAMPEPKRNAPPVRNPHDAAASQDYIIRRLTRIARTTSSLPAVFEPSLVDPDQMGGVIELPRRKQPSYVVDGGYLNNRPIDLMLAAIYKRAAAREVVRKLILVEPRPDLPETPTPDPPQPNALENIWFYLRIPNYQSLKAALEQIKEHNRRVRQVDGVLNQVKRELTLPMTDDRPGPRQHNIWVALRLDLLSSQILGIWTEARTADDDGMRPVDIAAEAQDKRADQETFRRRMDAAHEAVRQEASALRAIETPFRRLLSEACQDWRRRADEAGDTNDRDARRKALVAEITAGVPESTDAEFKTRSGFLLDQIDTDFARRKTYRLIYDLTDSLYPPMGPDGKAPTPSRADIYERLKKTYWDPLNSLMGQWYRLRDALDIIDLSLAEVCRAVAGSKAYLDARSAALTAPDPAAAEPTTRMEAAVERLWRVLRDATLDLIRLPEPIAPGQPNLLEDVKNEDLNALLAKLTAGDVENPPRFTQRDLDLFASYFTHRCTQVCGNLPRHQEPVGYGAEILPDVRDYPTIIKSLLGLLDYQAAWAAQALLSVYEPVPAVDAMTANVPGWPLAWAARATATNTESWIEAVHARAERVDAYLFPIENTTGLKSRDLIDLVRVSPYDEQDEYSAGDPESKVAGDKLGNLSGFIKRSWRANDILFGRLDAANALVSSIMDRGRLAELFAMGTVEDKQRCLETLRSGIFGIRPGAADTSPESMDRIGRFLNQPERFKGDINRLEEWLQNLSPTPQGEANLARLRALLLARLQLEILTQELPQALAEEDSERREWMARGEDDRKPLRLSTPDCRNEDRPGHLPPEDTTRARWRTEALRRAAAFLNGREAGPGEKTPVVDPKEAHTFFKNGYRIGQESIAADLPPQVLLRQGLGLLLIVIHILQNLIRESKAQGAGPVKALATWVLRPLGFLIGALYGFFNTVTKGDKVTVVLQTVLATIAVGLGIGGLLRLFGMDVVPEWSGYLPLSLAAFALLWFYGFLRYHLGWIASTTVLFGLTFGVAQAILQRQSEPGTQVSNWPWFLPLIIIVVAVLLGTVLVARCHYKTAAWVIGLASLSVIVILIFDAKVTPDKRGITVRYLPPKRQKREAVTGSAPDQQSTFPKQEATLTAPN